jgi:small subunit ribosomal protein S17
MSDITNNEENAEVEVTDTPAPVADVTAAPVDETTAPSDADTPAPVAEVTDTVAPAAPADETTVPTDAVAPTPVAASAERTGPVIKTPAATTVSTAPLEDDGTRGNPRKVREGIVISNKMDMTLVVAVNERVSHPRYGKTVQRTKKLYVHDENNDAKVGDRVRVQETRPLSKLKRWRLTDVVERAR